jgi:hypothetical protein
MDAARSGAKRARADDAPPAASARSARAGAVAAAPAEEAAEDAEDAAEDEEEEGEEEAEEEYADSAYDGEEQYMEHIVTHAAARAYDASLARLVPDAAAAASLSRRAGGLTYDGCDAASEDGERVRSATLTATLHAAGSGARGAQLRMVYHNRVRSTWREFFFSVCYRAADSAPPQYNTRAEEASWTVLCRAALEGFRDAPVGHDGEEYQQETQHADGLTPAACATLRHLVFGGSGACAGVSDAAFLTLAFTAVGALGLPDYFCLSNGYVWHSSQQQQDAGAPPYICWMERALRAAARAPHPWDAEYKAEDLAARRAEWEQEQREMDSDSGEERGSDDDDEF